MARQQERVADGIYRYVLQAKGGRKPEVRYGATVWVRGPWGDRTQRRKEGFPREKDAKAWRAQQMADSAAGLATTGGDVNLGVWIGKYLDLHAVTWSHGMMRNTRNQLNYFAPLFDLSLSRITPVLVASRIAELQQRYAVGTVRGARAALSSCLKQAVEFGMIPRNAVRSVKAPASTTPAPDYWTAEQVKQLRDAVRDDAEFAVLVWLLSECWLRIGEAMALTWADVDLARGRLHVRRTVKEGPGASYVGETPKTARSRRTLAISSELVRLVREAQDRDRLATGKSWSPARYVVTPERGSRSSTWVRRRLVEVCEAAGLPRISPHDLRHAGASIAIRGGLGLKVVQERLGHTSVKFTMDRYVSANESDHQKAAGQFADLLKGAV